MNIIKTEFNTIIALKNDLIEFLQEEFFSALENKDYTKAHNIVDVHAQVQLFSSDALLEYSVNKYELRLIEEV